MESIQTEIYGTQSKKLDSRDDLELWLLGTETIPEFNAFVLKVYNQAFTGGPAGAAEMEMLVLKYHRRVGIPWQIIGEPVNFWNRDRYPCAFRMGEYKEYMRTHHPERFAFLYG